MTKVAYNTATGKRKLTSTGRIGGECPCDCTTTPITVTAVLSGITSSGDCTGLNTWHLLTKETDCKWSKSITSGSLTGTLVLRVTATGGVLTWTETSGGGGSAEWTTSFTPGNCCTQLANPTWALDSSTAGTCTYSGATAATYESCGGASCTSFCSGDVPDSLLVTVADLALTGAVACQCNCSTIYDPESYGVPSTATCTWQFDSSCASHFINRGTLLERVTVTLESGGSTGVRLRILCYRDTAGGGASPGASARYYLELPVTAGKADCTAISGTATYDAQFGDCSAWSTAVVTVAVGNNANDFTCSECGYPKRDLDPDQVPLSPTVTISNASAPSCSACESAINGAYGLTASGPCQFTTCQEITCAGATFLLAMTLTITFDCDAGEHTLTLDIRTWDLDDCDTSPDPDTPGDLCTNVWTVSDVVCTLDGSGLSVNGSCSALTARGCDISFDVAIAT